MTGSPPYHPLLPGSLALDNVTSCTFISSGSNPLFNEVYYCYTITNTGSVTFTLHDLIDSELGTILSNHPYSLPPNGSYWITQSATINATTINTATWTAYALAIEAESTDRATVNVVQLFSLGDYVWYDTNRDGIQDAGEPGVQNIAVDLYDNGACAGQAIASDTTDTSGIYRFTGLVSDTYCLWFSDIPTGWFITLQNQGGDDTVDSDADPATGQITNINLTTNDLDEDMGLYAEGSIGDTVWCDANLNGSYDPGEGVAGVTVRLYQDPSCDDVAGDLFDTQDTVGDGQYLFAGLPVGPPVGPPECYVASVDVADMGACNNPITPISYPVALEANNPDDLDNNFGFQQPEEPELPPVVPEASTLILLGSALSGLAGYVGLQIRARRRRS